VERAHFRSGHSLHRTLVPRGTARICGTRGLSTARRPSLDSETTPWARLVPRGTGPFQERPVPPPDPCSTWNSPNPQQPWACQPPAARLSTPKRLPRPDSFHVERASFRGGQPSRRASVPRGTSESATALGLPTARQQPPRPRDALGRAVPRGTARICDTRGLSTSRRPPPETPKRLARPEAFHVERGHFRGGQPSRRASVPRGTARIRDTLGPVNRPQIVSPRH
jgi:hypothetical protein